MFEDIKTTLEELTERQETLRRHFELDKKESEIAELEKRTHQPDFWNDNESAQKVMREIAERREWVDAWKKIDSGLKECRDLLLLADEEKDEAVGEEIRQEVARWEKELSALEFRKMLGKPEDAKNAILTIHPGAGGTESQDWAQMLMRMYQRWIERRGFKEEILDFQAGEEAGIKSVSIEVTGPYAYGYLKAEAGVHRLVRISPFDANSRRHTSFASVFVYPEVENAIEVDVDEKDLRIDTFRASGAGGQHVNKTSSAIRITHIPTGIVVQCQNERSQHRNKEAAMKMLLSKLYQLKLEEEAAKKAQLENTKKDIAWGNQIRSYVFHPYNLVKDHRTGYETSDIQAVMDGELDEFIHAYLIQMQHE
ncbi:MAG: peptide chain release factor 2 [candidate division KSB1 bacterium]|nr:peptide chain release factor 2 [candidate division KSB1 bacterium]